MKILLQSSILLLFLIHVIQAHSQTTVNVTVDLTKNTIPVSPYIYGKNNVLPNTFLSSGSNTEVNRAKAAGIRLVRQGGGNNSTKYNWRLKLSSHPDWYNNVYANDWDAAAQNLQNKLPGVQGMWSFQLLGKAAANNQHNFNDWDYNQSQWWSGVNQNLAGGGQANPAGGSQALVEGDPDLYLEEWTSDSTVGILDKWFGANGLGYDKNVIQYWDMDNEPEIWSGTHDDVMKTQCSAEEFMQRYFSVAKAARAKFPGIKLVGPVPANEWQWYRWGSDAISYNGKKYCWLEYFILRIAEEEKATEIRLLDVLDIHYYPGSSDPATILQFHRVFFDRNYIYPEANGVHTLNGGWDTTINKEYILGRCSDWLTKYIGTNHGVGLAVTECGINSTNANVQAVWYASTMGEFMKNSVEIFTPWSWDLGMWETIHLFSRYNQENYVPATSQDETLVSAYPTINESHDSMTVVLVNRSVTETRNVNLMLNGYTIADGSFSMNSISGLGSSETFNSHTSNALKKTQVTAQNSQISVNLAPLSVNSILLKGLRTGNQPDLKKTGFNAVVYPNPATQNAHLQFILPERNTMDIRLFASNGQLLKVISQSVFESGKNHIELNTEKLTTGMYFVKFKSGNNSQTLKFFKNQ
ncbi:MAG: glycoside hydrolase family 44 protein [Prolixibacteraceae bacterium]|jgi:hypothetical protein